MFFVLSLLFVVIFCCKQNKEKKNLYRPKSNGRINDLTVVMPKEGWNNDFGNFVKKTISPIYEGLPLDEQIFTINFLSPKTFSGFARHNRNIIWFEKDTVDSFKIYKNLFASPQIVAKIKGSDIKKQKIYLEKNALYLRALFVKNERAEKMRRIKKSLSKETILQKTFGISIKYPSAYKTVMTKDNFIWIEKPIKKGHLNIIVYTIPYNNLVPFTENKIILMRDSIGKKYVSGRSPKSYMVTEKSYPPYFYTISLDKRKSYHTKGIWDVKGGFMAGPFVNYTIEDKENNQWIVIEGFAFAPSVDKRNYMFELNTILLSFKKIKEN